MSGDNRISRRTVLRGLGTAMALPWLEAMMPRGVGAALAAPAAGKAPVRMAFLYVPNGVHIPDWTPKTEGEGFELPWILEPLAKVRQKLTVLTGLTADKARAHGDGGGDHARALAAFLTGCQPRKTDGADIKAGVSADQVAAARIGDRTRFPSLELGCDRGAVGGSCDSGYSCAYSSNISWKTENTPMAKETNPRALFERLFSNPADDNAARGKRDRLRKSVLDLVNDDAGRLRGKLGVSDQRKLDEYLTSVRELEQRLQRAERFAEVKPPAGFEKPGNFPTPNNNNKRTDYPTHVRLMLDLMAVALQTDSTRIATFMYANEGDNNPYPFIGVNDGHHDLSHHGKDARKQEKIRKINRFHMEQFAAFLERLDSVKEGEGTLLDNCVIAYGSGNSDGDRHNHDDLPVALAGRAGGRIKSGRHIRVAKETPLNNLWLSMLDMVGAPIERLGDSTGTLKGLEG